MSDRFDYFVVFAEMRTGSNFLESNLNEFPGLHCYGEAFNPHFMGHKNGNDLLGITLDMRRKDPLALIRAMTDQPGILPGFRFFNDHDPRILQHVLADPRCAKVILTRNPIDSYVSLKIASQTGQWKLTKQKHRREATMRFDMSEFVVHLENLQTFQLHLLHALQTSGQTAFYLAYEDVQDITVINGLAQFLGVSHRRDALSAELKKQNPAPLSELVENFDEMRQALSQLDKFDLTRTPNFEPRRGPVVPGYVAAAGAPVLFMPIKGGPVARVEAWLASLGDSPETGLRRDFTQKTLRQWKRGHPGHRSFSVVTHPLERAHTAFCDHILSVGPTCFPEIRALLRDGYHMPIPKNGPNKQYSVEQHRLAFLSFLTFLKSNLTGQTEIRVDPSWASQSSVLQGMGQFAVPDMILRAERLQADLDLLSAQAGIPSRPLPDLPGDHPYGVAQIYDPEVEAAAREVYQRDYMMFGYRAWA